MSERWRTYQRERFPLGAYGLLAGVVALAAMSFSTLVRGASAPELSTLAAAAASAFLFFAQMRVLDEFKDFDDDSRFRPYRAVPRGLVRLSELGWIGVAAMIAQLAIALAVDARLPWLLALVWLYLALTAAEFFIPDWLKAHPLAYLASHVPLAALIALYLTAFDWLPARSGVAPALLLFAMAAMGAATLLEIGRKIRAPHDEEAGVVTYTAVWGLRAAVIAWWLALVGSLITGWFAACWVGFSTPFALIAVLPVALAFACGWQFVRHPTTRESRRIEKVSALGTLVLYLGMGPLDLLTRI